MDRLFLKTVANVKCNLKSEIPHMLPNLFNAVMYQHNNFLKINYFPVS